jgi:hypothetical protein
MNLINCLRNIIGSNNPAWNVPSDFNLYVESLPGLSRADIVAMADSDYQTTGDFIQDKVSFAMNMVVAELSQWIIQDFRQNSVLDRMKAGKYPTGVIAYNTPQPLNRGIKFTRRKNDDYGLLVIPYVKVLVNNSGLNTITITDNIGQVKSVNFTAVAGIPTEVNVDFITDGGEAYLTLDNASLATAELKVGGCCNRPYNESNVGLWRVSGWDGSGEVDNTFGFIAEAQYQCDQSQIACIFRNSVSFQQACLYRLGVDLLDELINTVRANSKTIHNKEEKIELRAKFENDYERRMEILRVEARTMLSRPRTNCIACNGTRYAETQRQSKGYYR